MELKRNISDLEQKFYDLCSDVLKSLDLNLYDLEYFQQNHKLRLFIFKEETLSATIDDCISVDRALTPHIEDLDWMPDRLELEVSSPGLYRRIRTAEHFKMSLTKRLKIIFSKQLDSYPQSVLLGTLMNYKEEEQEIEVKEEKTNELFSVSLADIKDINLEPNLHQ